MLDDLLAAVATSPWSLPLLFALVFGDAFLVVIPGGVNDRTTGCDLDRAVS